MFQNLQIQSPVGLEDEDDTIDVRRDWMVHVNVPKRCLKICEKINEAIQKGGYRKHCSLATVIDGPHNTPVIKINTYKRVATRIALLKYVTQVDVL